MKITDPQVIQTGEKKLIDAVQQHLDLETVKTILMDRMAETLFESKGGQIVVHDNQIAFRLNFELKLNGSLLFDRQGNYIDDPSGSSTLLNPETVENETNRLSDALENDLTDQDDDQNAQYSDLLDDDEESERAQNFSADDTGVPDPDDALDDDINDILQESREFWNQKKGS
ncbi:MAG: hypothetical protein U5K27_04255 [Desulfotignum sp.]|nr:hypothetical protein [Desulfotignum sp.]